MEAHASAMVIAFGLIGALVAIVMRYNQKHRRGWRSTLAVLFNDFTFEEYATLNLLSLIYAILLGGLSGSGIAFILQAPFSRFPEYLVASMICFLLIPLSRIGIEGYTVIYKTARDASAFLTLSTRRILKNEPSLQEKSAWIKEDRIVEGRFGYEPQVIYKAIVEELTESGIDTKLLSYENTSFADNMVIVVDNSGKKIAVFTQHSDGEWTKELA